MINQPEEGYPEMRIPAIGKSISTTVLLAAIATTLEHPGMVMQPVNLSTPKAAFF